MRAKLILIFIVTFTVPIVVAQVVIHDVATSFSEQSVRTLNQSNIGYVRASANRFLGTAYDFSMYLAQDKNIIGYFSAQAGAPGLQQVQSNVQDALSTLPMSNTFIKSVGILGVRGQYMGSGTERLTFSEEDMRTAYENRGYYFWSASDAAARGRTLEFCRLLRQPQNLSNEYGFLKISLNLEELDAMLRSSSEEGYSYLIVGSEGEIVYQLGDCDTAGLPLTPGFLAEAEGSTLLLEEQGCYLTPARLDYGGWTIVSVSGDSFTPYLSQSIRQTLLLSAAVCFLFCLLLALFFTGLVVSPLRRLGDLMQGVEREDYSVRFTPRGGDEIAVLAVRFNHMTERLETLYNEVYLSNLKLKDSQLAALQAQINPHFLYNTLDTIYWMSQFHHTDDVSRMVSALSRLFRLSLSGDEDDMIPLEQELEHVRCYMYIQQIRYQDGLSYDIRCEVDPERYSVLKLVLQPIVENAVIHGVEAKGRGGVVIRVAEEDGALLYTVTDDGGAADEESINRLLREPARDGAHIGLKNIHDRIKLRFPGRYGIRCRVEEGRTIFEVRLPLIRQGGELQ